MQFILTAEVQQLPFLGYVLNHVLAFHRHFAQSESSRSFRDCHLFPSSLFDLFNWAQSSQSSKRMYLAAPTFFLLCGKAEGLSKANLVRISGALVR